MIDEKELRAKALEGYAWEQAHENIGYYAKSVLGGEHSYETRSERMEGWNDCASAHSKKAIAIMHWLSSLPSENKTAIEDLLLNGSIGLVVREDKEGEITIYMDVNCNDLFFWGCSDSEEVLPSEIPDLLKCLEEAPNGNGELLWVARKRGMRPQGAFYKLFDDKIKPLFDACGPKRKVEFGNPESQT